MITKQPSCHAASPTEGGLPAKRRHGQVGEVRLPAPVSMFEKPGDSGRCRKSQALPAPAPPPPEETGRGRVGCREPRVCEKAMEGTIG